MIVVFHPALRRWCVMGPFGMAMFETEAAARRCQRLVIAINLAGIAVMLAIPFVFAWDML